MPKIIYLSGLSSYSCPENGCQTMGGGWAWMSSKDILLKYIVNDDRYSSARVGGLCVGIFSSLQGWLSVEVLCALQCAKNSVGSCRQSHGC